VDLRWEILFGYWPLFVQGLEMTLTLTLVALVAGMALGAVFGVVRSARGVLAPPGRRAQRALLPLQWIAGAYFALMPTLVHPDHGLLLSGDAALRFRQEHGAFFSGSLALTLNAGAYVAEIFRAGIISIGRGQVEAAHALGLHYVQTLRLILLPQAFRRMMPAFVNEAITLTKDSSLVSAIGLAELALAARTVAGAYSRYWEPYLAISAIYLIITLLLSQLAKRLETPAHAKAHLD